MSAIKSSRDQEGVSSAQRSVPCYQYNPEVLAAKSVQGDAVQGNAIQEHI